MDYFDSNFKKDEHSDLPEDFGWNDMKGGIYEKMQKENPTKKNRYWPLLLLLLIGGCGGGSWLAFEYWNATTIDSSVAHNQNTIKESERVSKNNKTNTTIVQEHSGKNSAQERLSQTKLNTQKPNEITTPLSTTFNTKKTEAITKNNPTSNFNQTNKLVDQTEAYIIDSPNTIEEKLTDEKTTLAYNIASTPLVTIEKQLAELLPKTFSLLNIKLPAFRAIAIPVIDKKRNDNNDNNKSFENLSFGLAGGIMNWAAFDATNINSNFVSGYPGYNINPFLTYSFNPKHSIQLDYGYTALEELFDYDGSRPISVLKEDETIGEVVSSLTGNVIDYRRENVYVNGTRTYREVKYNNYQFQTLSLAYRFNQEIKKKASFGLYLGASYLFKLNGEGKRLNEELDVVSFDNSNPIFQKNQLGLRFGLSYNYQLNPNIGLFTQVISTKYFTNWEQANSNSTSRPLLYGLQLGLRYSLKK